MDGRARALASASAGALLLKSEARLRPRLGTCAVRGSRAAFPHPARVVAQRCDSPRNSRGTEDRARSVNAPTNDETFMRRALELADIAAISGEVPVGAVLVQDGHVIAM